MQVDICMLVDNDMVHDSRLHREATTLANEGWNVLIIAYYVQNRSHRDLPEWQEISGYKIWRHPIPRTWLTRIKDGVLLRVLALMFLPFNDQLFIKAFRVWKTAQQTAVKALKQIDAKVYHVHDYPNLVAIHSIHDKHKTIIYDSHELYFDRVQRLKSRLDDMIILTERRIEKHYIQSSEAVVTVGDKIADHLANTHNIERPIVLRNAVDLRQIAVQPARTFSTTENRTVVHSGGIAEGRRLRELIQSMQYLPSDVAFVFVGSGPLELELTSIATALGTQDRFFILPSVQPHEVATTIAQGDVAIVSADPSTGLNGQYSLPNKYFEAVAAGLPVVTSLATEIVRLTQQYEIGVSVDVKNPQEIARGILDVLDPQRYELYRRNAQLAKNEINWEQEEKKLINLYQRLMDNGAN